jgi:hypothetical protein
VASPMPLLAPVMRTILLLLFMKSSPGWMGRFRKTKHRLRELPWEYTKLRRGCLILQSLGSTALDGGESARIVHPHGQKNE